MAYSQVQICNLALLKFGSPKITSIDDQTPEAAACKALWDIVRDEVLYDHPWNFAMKRADLGAARGRCGDGPPGRPPRRRR